SQKWCFASESFSRFICRSPYREKAVLRPTGLGAKGDHPWAEQTISLRAAAQPAHAPIGPGIRPATHPTAGGHPTGAGHHACSTARIRPASRLLRRQEIIGRGWLTPDKEDDELCSLQLVLLGFVHIEWTRHLAAGPEATGRARHHAA